MYYQSIIFATDESAKKLWDEKLAYVFRIAEARISRRIGKQEKTEASYVLKISRSEALAADAYAFSAKTSEGITLTAQSLSGLLMGIGRFLRETNYNDNGFEPTIREEQSSPDCPVRGIQMDSHFCNFYHMAPESELREYVEDLALWGVNYIDVVFPLIDFCGWEDPEVYHVLKQIQAIYGAARALDMHFGMEIVPNQDFVTYREDLKASPNIEEVPRRGNNGHNICPNKPGALEYIKETYGYALRFLKEHGVTMDFICFWPYDEGGCSCELCSPWGANGFFKASHAIWETAREILPDVKIILSTWMFDTPGDQGEWSGLADNLARGNGWVDYILADSHTDFPEYPLTHEIPGGLPLLNYPEISMWALYPWGGYGANPLPKRFEQLWGQVREKVSGGIAYSEGIFDDINKISVTGFYWDREASVEETLRQYICYEFSADVYRDVREIIDIIESNHIRTAVGKNENSSNDCNMKAVDEELCARARRAAELADKVDALIPEWAAKSWRWRILYIRAHLDRIRYERSLELSAERRGNSWTKVLIGSEEAKRYMEELTTIYHSNLNVDDELHPMFRAVRPAVKELGGTV